MRTFAEIEAAIEIVDSAPALLRLGEEILERWLEAHGERPTADTSEGFHLLALHRQAARGDPSFNACRETCRELVFHHNLITLQPARAETARRLSMMRLVAGHICYFISGKLENAKLGEFCCSSRALRLETA